MPNAKVPQLPIKGSPTNSDLLYLVDVNDHTDDITGSSKQIQVGNLPFLQKTGGQMSGQIDMNTNKIINVPTPLVSGDAANKNYVDSVAQGLSVKTSVRLATAGSALAANTYNNGTAGVGATLTANANGALSVDGTAVNNGDRILVKDEVTASHNGIYTVTQTGDPSTPYILTRSTDNNINTEFSGAFTFVIAGSTNINAGFVCITQVPIIVGTTGITFTEFSNSGSITTGNGLQQSAGVISLTTPVILANGGTGATLSGALGGIIYSTSSALAILAPTATANQILLSGANAAPIWSTAIYPASTLANQLLYSSANNTITGLTTANNAVLITNGSGAPSLGTTLPSTVQSNITQLGTISSGVWHGSAVPVANGGTGATTAATARSNLGAVNIAGDTMTGALQFSGSTNAGLILNSLTTTQQNALTPTAGNLIYNSTLSQVQKYENGQWVHVSSFDVANLSGGVMQLNHTFTNLLSNAGFDSWLAGISTVPDGWTTAGGITVAQSTNTTIGTYSAQLTFDTSNTGQFYQDVFINTSDVYTISCFIQRSSGSGNAKLVLAEGNSPFTEYTSVELSTAVGFQFATLSFQPTTGTKMRIAIKSFDATSSVWIVSAIMFTQGKNVAPAFVYAPAYDSTNQTIYGNKTFAANVTINGTVTLSTALSLNQGGTGITSLTAGSILYSDATTLKQDNANLYYDGTNHRVGLGTTSPTARLHLAAGTATANTAPIKLTTGTNLTTPEDGAFEYSSSHLYFTIGSTRYQLDQQSTAAGDVVGPASATDHGIARFDGTTGKLVEDSGVTIDDSNNITAGTWQATKIAEIYGGTNQSTYILGDLLYASATNTLSKLAGNTTGTRNFLRQTGTGSVSAAPAWDTIQAGDLPGSFSGFANPSASIGLTANNGSATTAMKSDATPALSQAIVPTWTGVHTHSPTLAANTSGDGIVLADTTVASSGNQQYSPRLRLTGQGWKTNSTAASQNTDWIIENQPIQGAANPTTNLVTSYQVNAGGYSVFSTMKSSGAFDLASGGVFSINGTTVLSNNTLGSGIVSSSLTSVGTITSGTWTGTTIAVANGGTGQTTYTDGQLLIGNTTGNTLTVATLTGTANQITVTNGHGSITLSTPQNIHTGASPTFAGLTLTGAELITSASASAFQIGPNGATNPTFTIDASAASAATGLTLTAKAAASGVVLQPSSSGSNEDFFIKSKGSSAVKIQPGSDSTSAGLQLLNAAGTTYIRADSTNKRLRIGDATAPTGTLDIVGKFVVNSSGLVINYNNVATAGWGVPAINGYGRSAAVTAAVASVATYTVGASDGSFIVSANVLVTTATAHNFNVQVTYTDEGNTSRTVTFNVQQLGGTLVTAITNVTGAGPYEGVPLHIRAKASTAITILTSGTFTTVTYNVEGMIAQIA